MRRRDFIKNSALASSLMFVPGFVRAMDDSLFTNNSFKRLVIIQLAGGNDGLNTVVPFRNDIYYKSRPSIAVSSSDIIRINDELGFHKSLAPLKALYDNGELTITNKVGYPNPNRSHFRSTDIWQTASSANTYLETGWVGRYLDIYGKHPYNAVELGNRLSMMTKGESKIGMVLQDGEWLHKLGRDPFFGKVLSTYGDDHLSEHNMGYLYQTMIDARQSARYIYEKSRVYKSDLDYGDTEFGKQLKTLAEFINSGLETKVYFASLAGFDTHANQTGTQERLLGTYAKAVSVLVEDLKANNSFDDTLILTFSEFGRRVAQNEANGTDHGAANNVFVIGNKLRKPGLFNQAPDLTDLDKIGDVKYEIDFRSIYVDILENWMGVDRTNILDTSVPSISLI